MDLILWRHCDAEAGSPDIARRLTARDITSDTRTRG